MKKNISVAIVIPAYNEGRVIGTVIKDLQKQLHNKSFDYQIIVVNDGSRDDTAAQSKGSGVHVIDHVLNSGSGGATATGLSYAQQNGFDVAATLDADGQHDAGDLIRGIELIQDSDTDLLIGSRLLDATGMSRTKVLGNRGLSFITYLLFRINVTDSQSGLRIFSRKALDNLRWQTSGYEFCSEMLWRAKQQDLNIAEYPIHAIYTEYSMAKGQNNWNAIHIIKSLVQRRLMELFGE